MEAGAASEPGLLDRTSRGLLVTGVHQHAQVTAVTGADDDRLVAGRRVGNDVLELRGADVGQLVAVAGCHDVTEGTAAGRLLTVEEDAAAVALAGGRVVERGRGRQV